MQLAPIFASALLVVAAVRPVAALAATTYEGTVTGVQAYDQAGGTGNYSPAYVITPSQGTLHYAFAADDSIDVQGASGDVYGVLLTSASGSSPAALDSAGGKLNISATRGTADPGWGLSMGVNVQGSSLTVNGNASVYAQSDSANSAAIGVRAYQSTVTFNGDTAVRTSTPGYSQGVWVYQSTVTFNGDTTIVVSAKRENTDGVYNSGGGASRVTFNGDLTIATTGEYPSDNAHGIYNDNQNSQLRVTGGLKITATANGSTVFGIRNQGQLSVGQDASITATGTRSAFGIANTHRTARMSFAGNVDIAVVSTTGYVPFGNPTGIGNSYPGTSSINFAKAVTVNVSAAAEAYAVNNASTLNFNSATDNVALQVASTCSGCDVYGIRNDGGTVTAAGGLSISTSPGGAGKGYAIWNVAADGRDATATVNAAGGQAVKLQGDLVTGSLTNAAGTKYTGALNVNLNTSDSYLRGSVGGFVDPDPSDATVYTAGSPNLSFSKGASWIPTGTGTMAADFGSGTLALANGGAIDLAASWGSFRPGSIPAYSLRVLDIQSSTNAAKVSLGDGATFRILSDIRNGAADRIQFGTGVTGFSATGTQVVAVSYDPALDDTSWVNAATMKTGTVIPASKPIVVIDASAADGGTARLQAVQGATNQWNYENDLVRFSYSPSVALSADGSKVVLTGLAIAGRAGDASTDAATSTGSSTSTSGGTSTGASMSTGTSSPSGILARITPSETVKTAADAGDSLRSLWALRANSIARKTESLRRDTTASETSGLWAEVDGGGFDAKTGYARSYRQSYGALAVGVDRNLGYFGGWKSHAGGSVSYINSNAAYERGNGKASAIELAGYGFWVNDGGTYLQIGARTASLENKYASSDSLARHVTGTYRTQGYEVSAEAGHRISLPQDTFVEPQLALTASRLAAGKHMASNGVTISQDNIDGGSVRAGMLLGKAVRFLELSGDIYLRLSAINYFGDGLAITAAKGGGSLPVESESRNGTGGEVGLGGRFALLPRRGFVYFEASSLAARGIRRTWNLRSGLRYEWY
ncbi:outer membrane autotransporter barrel domain-containing protein [Variovorax sp. YR266]|uniref:autotransporter outer membrane beta-barrel domain-containing protein n=1 Tax=Variovorax sp. YR266 TaxID=1884386 RepID=UPI00089CB4A4|nr:autotransporter outer membrane beta-barrel domain-containing protein [Variovorax sp. YR266]SDY33265.1 outer membrane autotransporter barrel domain-containing protein [Variovorax sp. YR266]